MDISEKADLLINLVKIEQKAQTQKWSISESVSLKQLKGQGLAIHPLKITRRSYGFADYPLLEFSIPFDGDFSNFRNGIPIEFFSGDQSCNGTLKFLQGKRGELLLHAPEFPEWMEDKSLGIKLIPDDKSFSAMISALKAIKQSENKSTARLFEIVHGIRNSKNEITNSQITYNDALNDSQNKAIDHILSNKDLCVLHGPPGTGKTTTLIAAVNELIKKGEKVLITAPSNAAVDHISIGLINKKIKVLRLGNTSKINEDLYNNTPEGLVQNSNEEKQIKTLKKRANEMRKLASQYKRNFGKSEREQRKLLFQEVKAIRKERKQLENYSIEKAFDNAQVITGTPVALTHDLLTEKYFDTLILDEAGQCLEPMAWVAAQKASKLVLAGDPFQLPPTVISDDASKKGLNISILEQCFKQNIAAHLLNTQYRMQEDIAGFSNNYFYEGNLESASSLKTESKQSNIIFYDTAGSDKAEKEGSAGFSLVNEGELDTIHKLIEEHSLEISKLAIISPYAAQVSLAKELFPKTRVSTIDAFQGQENDTIIISLVRSNENGVIGFLKDYRRMNVALTRAKQKLFVIGDSATFGNDKFYAAFLEYVEEKGGYKSVFEIDY